MHILYNLVTTYHFFCFCPLQAVENSKWSIRPSIAATDTSGSSAARVPHVSHLQPERVTSLERISRAVNSGLCRTARQNSFVIYKPNRHLCQAAVKAISASCSMQHCGSFRNREFRSRPRAVSISYVLNVGKEHAVPCMVPVGVIAHIEEDFGYHR